VNKLPNLDPGIFVQIPAYRDPECQWTIKDMFEKAKKPERIFAGICWQFVKGKDDFCFEQPYPRPEQVRVIEIDARESKGVCWARAKIQKLWQDEEFTLQIDSHMRFEQDWDETLINMLAQCDSPKAVLTTYPADYIPPNNIPNRKTHILAAKEFNKQGIFLMGSRSVPKNAPKPIRGAFIGACALFGKSDIIHEVPYDPYLYFFGEEITLSARLWTHGYDIYHPNNCVMYHYWKRDQRSTHFNDHSNWEKLNEFAFERVRFLLGNEEPSDKEAKKEISKYGLGTVRTLEQYQEYAGVEFAKREFTPSAYEGVFPSIKKITVSTDEYQGENNTAQENIPEDNVVSVMPNNGPQKIMENNSCIIYDDFLAEEDYQKLYQYCVMLGYKRINTQGTTNKVWDLSNGFPLRSEKSIYYYADQVTKPNASWCYPSKSPFDLFIDGINRMLPNTEHIVGSSGGTTGWNHFSVTSWIYPQNTSLSLHDDGSGFYTGAYVYFLSPKWKPHWGGLLIMLSEETNRTVQQHKNETTTQQFHQKKWLHLTELERITMEMGPAHCIFPKRNRMVYIANDAYHMVTQVTPSAGDHTRISLAGFFNRYREKNEKA
jgi:hypothetical protein